MTFLFLTGGGWLLGCSFLGRPCRLQKKTERGFGKPGVLVSEGGDPSKDFLRGGGVGLAGAGGSGARPIGGGGCRGGGGGGGGGGKEYPDGEAA